MDIEHSLREVIVELQSVIEWEVRLAVEQLTERKQPRLAGGVGRPGLGRRKLREETEAPRPLIVEIAVAFQDPCLLGSE